MIRRDRELLVRLGHVSGTIAAATTSMLGEMPDGYLPADKLQAIGKHLAEVSADTLARAAELDGRMLEYPERVIIDARP